MPNPNIEEIITEMQAWGAQWEEWGTRVREELNLYEEGIKALEAKVHEDPEDRIVTNRDRPRDPGDPPPPPFGGGP